MLKLPTEADLNGFRRSDPAPDLALLLSVNLLASPVIEPSHFPLLHEAEEQLHLQEYSE